MNINCPKCNESTLHNPARSPESTAWTCSKCGRHNLTTRPQLGLACVVLGVVLPSAYTDQKKYIIPLRPTGRTNRVLNLALENGLGSDLPPIGINATKIRSVGEVQITIDLSLPELIAIASALGISLKRPGRGPNGR